MQFGVWDGQAWLLTVFKTIMRFPTLELAEEMAARQREDWPEATWTVHVIGADDKPYIPEGS